MKKYMKKMIAFVLTVVMVLAMGMTAMAQTVDSGKNGNATITVANASKGETYSVVKLFDATVTGSEGGSIAYTGEIPSELSTLFCKDNSGNIHLYRVIDLEGRNPGDANYVDTYATELTSEQFAKMKTWAENQTAVASAVSDGSSLEFTKLPYGYYVVISSQGSTVTVDSTNPNAIIYDKNTKIPTASKTVDDRDVYIGETVTYTLIFDTTNYMGAGEKAQQVVSYTIEDTTPNFLSDVTVTSIKVDEDGNLDTENDQKILPVTQFNNKKIKIEWANGITGNYTNIYKNGAKIIITYTAKVTAEANVGDADGNRNVVTLTPNVDSGKETPEPWSETYSDDEIIKTYGAAIKKVDETGKPLAGAKFSIKGLTVTGNDGEYTVSDFDNSDSASDGTEMEADTDGIIIILGLASDVKLTVTETVAPNGYNKLTNSVELTPIKMTETVSFKTKTVYYDDDGNVVHESSSGGTTKTVNATDNDLANDANALKVENQKGTELPSTGGMGTTLFYLVGGILVIAAIVLLITRKRMSK